SINLRIPAEKTARDIRRNGNALTAARQDWTVSPVPDDAAQNFATQTRPRFRFKKVRCTSRKIEYLKFLQTIAQRKIHVCIDRLANLRAKPVIPLVINRAEIARFTIKCRTTQR